jgi:hypothetical protein
MIASYSQRPGRFLVWGRDGGGEERQLLAATGYAGKGEGLNSPQHQSVPRVGPLPRGEYLIGPPVDHAKLGPVSLPLTPRRSTPMLGRSGFYIHGDNGKGDRSASKGCIILPRHFRQEIVRLRVRTLVVGE